MTMRVLHVFAVLARNFLTTVAYVILTIALWVGMFFVGLASHWVGFRSLK